MQKKNGRFLMLVVLFFMAHPTNGATRKKKQSVSKPKAQVLDFENDVIEGDRKRPDLFSQASGQNLTLDAILYLRNDFNDYQQIEQGRQPGFFQKKK